jgi:hypothetical protein
MDFEGRLDLTHAMRERDAIRRRYEAVVGSSGELQAFVELNAANVRVDAIGRYLAWSEESPLSAPPMDPHEQEAEEFEEYFWAVR